MKRVIAAMFVALVLLWGGFSAFALWGDNYRKVLPDMRLEPNQADWQMLNGTGAQGGDGWAVVRPSRWGYSRIGISLPWPASPESFKRIEVSFSQDMRNRPVRLGWSRSTTISSRHLIPLRLKSNATGVVDTSWLYPEEGEVAFLVIEIVGVNEEPLLIEGVRMIPARPDFMGLQKRLFSEWFAFPPWTQRSANYTRTSLQPVMLSPVLAVAAWALLTMMLAVLLAGLSVRVFWLAFLAATCVGWFALDVRWQADLVSKSLRTVDSFVGKSWEQRRTADVDGELVEFIQNLKDKVGAGERRVFALGFGEYWRLRARYHALPWSTRSTERPIEHDWVGDLATGDLLLLLDTPHIDQVLPDFVVHDAGVFRRTLKPDDLVGRGAALIEGSSTPVLETLPRDSELVRAKLDDVPARAFYRVTARLRGKDETTRARLIVRWRDGEGEWVTATNRLFSVSTGGFEEYGAPFVLPDQHDITIFVVDESGRGLQAESVKIELLKEKNLLWLKSDSKGPYLVVRPVLVERLNRAYEVM